MDDQGSQYSVCTYSLIVSHTSSESLGLYDSIMHHVSPSSCFFWAEYSANLSIPRPLVALMSERGRQVLKFEWTRLTPTLTWYSAQTRQGSGGVPEHCPFRVFSTRPSSFQAPIFTFLTCARSFPLRGYPHSHRIRHSTPPFWL